MNAETLFSLSNLVAVAGWLVLLAAPRSPKGLALAGTWIPLTLASLYLVLIALHWGDASGSFSSLSGVAELFSNRWLLLAGWTHYLAFDLFVGTWETRDAIARGVSRWLLAPCLVLTFLFGPIGWLAYQIVRQRATK